MAGIKKEEAEKILRQNGYTVQKHVGEGACSHAFKCMNPKNKLVAAKVCAPTRTAWASLDDELRTAEELHSLKKQFKTDLGKLVSEDPKAKSEAEKSFKHFFKYLTVPKLKKSIKIDGETRTIAIFEAPLADSDTIEAFCETMSCDWATNILDITGPNHGELKRVAKHVLKGLQVLHKSGRVHGDIKPANILSTIRPSDGKQIYSVTDFGTMKSPESDRFSEMCACDIWDVGKTLLELWLTSLGFVDSGDRAGCVDYLHYGEYDGESIKLCCKVRFKSNPDVITKEYKLSAQDKKFVKFCKRLTEEDFEKRPTAEEALKDAYLVS